MKRLMAFVIGAALAASSFASGPTVLDAVKVNFHAFQAVPTVNQWSGSAYYDVRSKHPSAVLFNRIGDLTLRGKVFAEVDGFVGVQDSQGTPATIGFAVLWRRKLFDQIDLVFGAGGSMTAGKFGGGPIGGISVHF